ncbi:MAG: hypothetical protein JWQ49_5055 [Edaphobacter sp.]|nr:hypothetical protein [Edaphobacter sp.]
MAAIASLIAAFASVILVASFTALLIVGLWKLHTCATPRSSLKLPERFGPAPCAADWFACGLRPHAGSVQPMGRSAVLRAIREGVDADGAGCFCPTRMPHDCALTAPRPLSPIFAIHPSLRSAADNNPITLIRSVL